MGPSRPLSQTISEGAGIAIIVRVGDADAARAAEEQGAKAVAVDRAIEGIRVSTTLPLLWLGAGSPVDADAVAVRSGEADAHEIETVVDVRDEDELGEALEQLDPEIFLISPSGADAANPVETVLELLPDVPAGKLAIAHVGAATRDEVMELERAGFDAVLVEPGPVGSLVGELPPDV